MGGIPPSPCPRYNENPAEQQKFPSLPYIFAMQLNFNEIYCWISWKYKFYPNFLVKNVAIVAKTFKQAFKDALLKKFFVCSIQIFLIFDDSWLSNSEKCPAPP